MGELQVNVGFAAAGDAVEEFGGGGDFRQGF